MPRPTKGYILTTVEHEPLYQYQPLHTPDAIRIVVIERGQWSTTLKCSILQCLRGEHSYEALSYEWGPPSADDPSIMIDEARLRIRANLYEALSRMRCESDDRKLWIDAICIDQANREERNHQVQVMRGIYADASGVLVWLGPSAEGSDLIFRLKHDERLSQVFDPSWDTSPSAETKAFLALLSRTYWHRVWVQQELLLARRYTIHCGGGQIDDVDLTYLMSIIPKHKPDYILEFDENRHKEQYYTKIRESHAFNVITIKERKISVPALSKLGA
ncbi:hypothetical protein J1614_010952 [Plenodomus biglobosus]|nr:hypothetical protein J1614_010952 [Plenodomus biglobosus]